MHSATSSSMYVTGHIVRATGKAIRNQRVTSGVGRYNKHQKALHGDEKALHGDESPGSTGDVHPGDDCRRNGTGSDISSRSSGSGINGGDNRDKSVACSIKDRVVTGLPIRLSSFPVAPGGRESGPNVTREVRNWWRDR